MTAEFRTRLRRVRMKNGGADVRVLDLPKPNPEGEDWRGSIIASARQIGEYVSDEKPLVGYVILGLYGDGTTSLGWRYDFEICPIPRALLPAWLAEVVRRDLISECEARDVFNEMFEWQEG